MEFLKGMGAGLIAGACIGLAVMQPRQMGKRRLCRAMKTVGRVIEDMGGALRF